MSVGNIVVLMEIATVILATLYRKKYASSTEKYFFHFLWFTVFIEVSATLWDFFVGLNYWIFNIYIFLSYLFYFYWYYSILKKQFYKKIIIVFSIIFLLYAMRNFIILPFGRHFHTPTFVCGAIMISILPSFYFLELLNKNKILEIKHELCFWISIGLFLFSVGMVPYMIFSKIYINAELSNTMLITLNIILYGSYSLGFIWYKKENQYSLI